MNGTLPTWPGDVPEPGSAEYSRLYNAYIKDHMWFVVENDLIGGWAIGLWPVPVSAYTFKPRDMDTSNEDAVSPPGILVAEFMTRETAEYVTRMVNDARWSKLVP